MVLALFSLLQTFSSDRTAPGWWTKHRSSVCGRCSDGCWRTLRWWTLSCDNERYADGDILSTGIDANWTICRYTLFGQFFSSVFPSPSILNWFRTCVAIDCPSVFTLASRGRIREQCSIWWQQYFFFFWGDERPTSPAASSLAVHDYMSQHLLVLSSAFTTCVKVTRPVHEHC